MPTRSVLLEIAVDCKADALAAAQAGADRLELCNALDAHGLTASRELVAAAVAGVAPRVRTVAMVRPAPGPCVHDEARRRAAFNEAAELLEAGAGGVVFGGLAASGEIDEAMVREMVDLASGKETVFHRAFDLLRDPVQALARLADLGVTRVLTSGMSAGRTALDLGEPPPPWTTHDPWHIGGDDWPRRYQRLAQLVAAAGSRIEVLVGGGVRATNVRAVIDATGCRQVHSSARTGPKGTFSAGEVRGLVAAIS